MKEMENIVEIYFQGVSSANVLDGEIQYNHFERRHFDALALHKMKNLTESEVEGIYHLLEYNVGTWSGESGLNVFRVLKETAAEFLIVRENQPLCRYEELLRWRKLTGCIGEDLPVCAFLAMHTEQSGHVWRDFEWDIVLAHDNQQINRIIERGITENHFHLFGSAPSFQLSWLRLMNNVLDKRFEKWLEEMDEKKRVVRGHYASGYRETSLRVMHFQAAVIRLALFQALYIEKNEGRGFETIVEGESRKKIERLLYHTEESMHCRCDFQLRLDVFRHIALSEGEHNQVDYACRGHGSENINHDFEGERALIYQMLLGRVGSRQIPEIMMKWFYAYLVIKVKFREELVQVNENIGFENFSQYNKRKSGFLYRPVDEKNMIQHAVGGSFRPGNMRTLEIRITPGVKAEDNRMLILKYDGFLRKILTSNEFERVYYVLHFPKKKDEQIRETGKGYLETCRHYQFRRKLGQYATELIRFREKAPDVAKRVLGIDACSQEIGCRPEVFGPSFRRITRHIVYDPERRVKQWKITYHVGEDWLDFVDGLRAIDEAILFLNMKNGDRLGHATVLGLDVDKWYENKKYSIYLPLQDYLDNVVWLYHKLLEFNIMSCETLKGLLLVEYSKCFERLYGRYIDEGDIKGMTCGRDGGSKYRTGGLRFDISTYYDAWKLRGDDPCLYNHMLFSQKGAYAFQDYLVNRNIKDGDVIRKRPEVVILLFFYHYSMKVRTEGKMQEEISVSSAYVEGVRQIQRELQNYVARIGLGIEANPSSNYRISTMKSYAEHPISKMFNMGLTMDMEEIERCPQLQVCINTDDRGVFHTSLENEYALMGCAMEQEKNEEGQPRYKKQMVYAWLDYIRENGNQLSFLEEKSN